MTSCAISMTRFPSSGRGPALAGQAGDGGFARRARATGHFALGPLFLVSVAALFLAMAAAALAGEADTARTVASDRFECRTEPCRVRCQHLIVLHRARMGL